MREVVDVMEVSDIVVAVVEASNSWAILVVLLEDAKFFALPRM